MKGAMDPLSETSCLIPNDRIQRRSRPKPEEIPTPGGSFMSGGKESSQAAGETNNPFSLLMIDRGKNRYKIIGMSDGTSSYFFAVGECLLPTKKPS